MIDLAEGIRMVSNVRGIAYEDITADMPVEVAFEDAEEGWRVPVFRPVTPKGDV